MIDLHSHSTYSDGSLSPAALVDLAVEEGLSALALTDHDTTEGIPYLMDAANLAGISGVAGVEISVDFTPGTMHMLGYFLDLENEVLQDALVNIRDGREIRNRKILDKLCGYGLELEWSELVEISGSDVIGRPHFAQAMIKHGYVTNKTEAFEGWLAKGKPGYVDRFRLTPQQGVAAIRAAGGVAVLAHPFTLNLNASKLDACVAELVECGLQGIEVFYPLHNQRARSEYLKLAKKYDLVPTGGSDFHGDMNPEIRLGYGFGNVVVDDSILNKLYERC